MIEKLQRKNQQNSTQYTQFYYSLAIHCDFSEASFNCDNPPLWLSRPILVCLDVTTNLLIALTHLPSQKLSPLPKRDQCEKCGILWSLSLSWHSNCACLKAESPSRWWMKRLIFEHLWRCFPPFLKALSCYKLCWAVSHYQLLHENSSVVLPVPQDKHDVNCDKAAVVREEQPTWLLKVWAWAEMAHSWHMYLISVHVDLLSYPPLISSAVSCFHTVKYQKYVK